MLLHEQKKLPPNLDRIAEGGLRVRGCYKTSTDTKPLISIITATFNAEKYLEQSIRSCINQTYDNVEYIIVDGGSTDHTLEIIKKYDNFIDYYVSEPDKGLYYAINKGLTAANGDWIYVLGADDILVDVLHYVAERLENQNEIYYGDVYLKGKHKLFDGEFNEYKLMYYNVSHQSIFYPKSIFEKYRYDVRYPSAADYEFLLRCHADKKYKLVYMPLLIAIYNDVEGMSSKKEDEIFLKDKRSIIKSYFTKKMYLLFYIRYWAVVILKLLRIKDFLKKVVFKMKN